MPLLQPVASPPQRVILHALPKLFRELVGDAMLRAGIVVLADDVGDDELAGAVEALGADAVISSLDDDDLTPACARLMNAPQLRILAVSAEGTHGAVFEMVPQRRPLGELSAEVIVAAVTREGA
jgi:hypothetical protein